jgi:hypothetical protein
VCGEIEVDREIWRGVLRLRPKVLVRRMIDDLSSLGCMSWLSAEKIRVTLSPLVNFKFSPASYKFNLVRVTTHSAYLLVMLPFG